MQVILQVANHPSNLQVDDENNAHSPQCHIYLSCFRWKRAQNSDGAQKSDGAQNVDGTPESCQCFPEGISTTLPRTEVVRTSCSRTAVSIWKLLSTGFYHFLGCSIDLYTCTFNAFMISSHISKYKSLSSSPFRTFVGNFNWSTVW